MPDEVVEEYLPEKDVELSELDTDIDNEEEVQITFKKKTVSLTE